MPTTAPVESPADEGLAVPCWHADEIDTVTVIVLEPYCGVAVNAHAVDALAAGNDAATVPKEPDEAAEYVNTTTVTDPVILSFCADDAPRMSCKDATELRYSWPV